MSFAPVIPFSGYAGWKFLGRTMQMQKAAFAASATLKRDEAHFREKIGGIRTAEDLVSDRRLLKVALGAFGLDSDIDNRFFIRKVLEEGTLDTSDLANRLSNKSYAEFSRAFGFGDYSTPRTVLSDFPDEILAAYGQRQFEAAVGETDNNMRLVLNAERELPKLAAKASSETTKWLTVIGSKPLAEVVRTALGFPASFSATNVDAQVSSLRRKASAMFGSSDPKLFADPANMDKLVKMYLLRAQTAAGLGTTKSAALQLLQSGANAQRALSMRL
ncbi:MAG: DUF1217 domain-containing protein [Phaeovulum sp.]|uniref:DUF1217 domain-containing protein n=1 Tax=Phaeovulum sp. TaxID=2934796 RepID=UPI00272F2468|nr:DUF1217 domain-containing protein [Phaeovulum sp.]MDP2062212.1 DUF1217 domain-containing protein [Phaeovulum sp.]